VLAAATAIELKKLSQGDQASANNLELEETLINLTDQVISTVFSEDDSYKPPLEIIYRPDFGFAEVEGVTCGSTMDWRKQNQTDVSAFLASGAVYTDTIYTRAVALEGRDMANWSWNSTQEFNPNRLTRASGYSLWGTGGFDFDSLN
jgi:hypothetical protein